MPTSHLYQINEIMEIIVRINPKRILDIGVGFGKYGFLSREYLELWDGREIYNDWNRQIDGIEAYEKYLNPVHKYIYNKIYTGNASKIIKNIDQKYDLILLIDVIEHFTFKEGLNLLKDCENISDNIIISTPKDIGDQTNSFSNDFEEHKFQWKEKHFNFMNNVHTLNNKYSLLLYSGTKATQINTKLKKSKILNKIPIIEKSFNTIKKKLK